MGPKASERYRSPLSETISEKCSWRSFRCKKPHWKILFLSRVIVCWNLRFTYNYIVNLNLRWEFYKLLELNLNQAQILFTCLVDPLFKILTGNFSEDAICDFCVVKKAEFPSKMSSNWSFNLITTTDLNCRKIPY